MPATNVMPKANEMVPAPSKKMPSVTPGKEPPVKEVRIDTPPAPIPTTVPVLQPAPLRGQPVPTIAPNIQGNLRNPF